jgi:hypothetical protein
MLQVGTTGTEEEVYSYQMFIYCWVASRNALVGRATGLKQWRVLLFYFGCLSHNVILKQDMVCTLQCEEMMILH